MCNMVTNGYVKFDYNRLQTGTALRNFIKFKNNKNKNTWGPFLGQTTVTTTSAAAAAITTIKPLTTTLYV